MDDFIFGALPTIEVRLQQLTQLRKGVSHQQARSPRDPQPGQAVTLELSIGPDHPCDRAWVYYTTDGSDPVGQGGVATHGSALAMELVATQWDTLIWGYVRHFRATLPGQLAETILRYRIGAGSVGDDIFADEGAFYSFYVAHDPLPDWTRDAIVYQIFVDRFFPGEGHPWYQPANLSGFYGGRLKGITEKLDYLTALGVNTLWLSPIFPSPTHHGYDATDYFEVEPRLGTQADLRELLEKAHQRGIRVLLDLVPNHYSNQHPSFQQASTDPNSPYRDWYTFKHWPDQYASFFEHRGMPKVNLRYPPARQYLLDACVYWLKAGVDGFRVDHAVGPTPDFWADFRRTTRSARPDCWTFGEVVASPDVQLQFEGGLDGCLDFMLLEALRETFVFGRWNGVAFADFLKRHTASFPPDFSRPSFLDNHDMNRFLWAAGGDQRRLRLAALCQFSLPGAPVVYHGTEVGLSQKCGVHEKGHGLEESRQPHPWGAEQAPDLFAYYQSLTRLRQQAQFGRADLLEILQANADSLVYRIHSAGRDWLVVLNLVLIPTHLKVAGNWRLALSTDPDCLNQVENEQISLNLPPLGGMILVDQR